MKRSYLDYLDGKISTDQDVEKMREEISSIFERAKKAELELSVLSVEERLQYISKVKKILIEKSEITMDKIQKETFKSRTDIITSEVFGPIDFLGFLEKRSSKALKKQKVPTPLALQGKKSYILHEPLGTVLSIFPWNYPFFNAIVHSMTSLVCGNATIFKPSEHTPLKGYLEEIYHEAGIPENWIQVVYGDGQIGKMLVDQRPDKVFFIGSVETGKRVMKQASDYLIPVELELGGKDPMIVFEDANLQRVTSGALWGGLIASGQSCTSIERLMVQESIYEPFKKLIIKKANAIKVENGSNPDIEIGPMVTEFQTKIIRDHLEDALNKGAKLLTGLDWDRKSTSIPPLILEGVTPEMEVYGEESFGPIIPLFSFKDEASAIQLANDSKYGLSASIWSDDQERCRRVSSKIKTGNISINNVMLTEGNANLPFGGTKQSGIGRYKGLMGFDAFSNIKSVLEDKNKDQIESHWFPFDQTKHELFQKLIRALFKEGIFGLLKAGLIAIKLDRYANKVGKILN